MLLLIRNFIINAMPIIETIMKGIATLQQGQSVELKIISSPVSKSILFVTVLSATKLNMDIKIEMVVAIYTIHLNSFFIT